MTLNFAGAGAYEHHVPAAVWQIVGRGEFYSAYTPYQAEASQGTLQLIYEYQTMMTRLTGMDISIHSSFLPHDDPEASLAFFHPAGPDGPRFRIVCEDGAEFVRRDGPPLEVALVNAKSGGCAEDCGFCAQSRYAEADTPMHAMMEPEQILEHAKAAEAAGAHRFCMVTQGQGLSKRDFAKILEGARLVAVDIDTAEELQAKTRREILALFRGAALLKHRLRTERIVQFAGSPGSWSDRVSY